MDLETHSELSDLRAEIIKLTRTYADKLLAPKPFVAGEDPVGRFTVDFERALANFVGTRHALFVNSGSSANLVALSGLTSKKLGERALKPGD